METKKTITKKVPWENPYPGNTNDNKKLNPFKIKTDYSPSGDQPQAIESLVKGIKENERSQLQHPETRTAKTNTKAQKN